MSLNNTTIMGRLVRDPELRRTGQGTAVTSFTLAVDRDLAPKGQDKETDFIDCVAWKNTAEFINSYFRTGRMMVVVGRIQTRTWKDKDGKNRKATEVVADHVYFGDSKPEGSSHGGGYNTYDARAVSGNRYVEGGYSAPAAPASDFAMMDDDDAQLPFEVFYVT